MSGHPIATAEQHEHELLALAVRQHPVVEEACQRVLSSLREEAGADEEMLSCLDWAFEEIAFGAVVWSLNQDPLRPKVVTITRLEHPVDSHRVPGTRWGLDNPDSIYRVIPISGDEKYLIRGRVAEHRLTENYFTLWDPKMNTVDVLSGHDLVLDDDRRFVIEVDSNPADGRPNHIRSAPEAKEFYIRDVIMDWSLDEANELTVERLGPAPTSAPATLDEQATQAAEYVEKFAQQSFGWSNRRRQAPANAIAGGWTRDTEGALRNQVYVPGWFDLAPDEALVMHLSLGGAEYFTVPITNLWGTTMDIVGRTGSLNKAQCLPNADGNYTVVLSREDPGVHNWLDTCGLLSGVLTPRMAEFPGGAPDESVRVSSEVVKVEDLRERMPEGTTWVSPEERQAQRDERARGYLRRLPEVK